MKLLKAEKVDIHDDDLLELLLYSGRRSITKINPTEDDERGPIVSFLIPSTWFHSLLYFRKRIITMKRGKNLICNLLIKKWQENWFCVWPLRSPSHPPFFFIIWSRMFLTHRTLYFFDHCRAQKKNEYNSDSEKKVLSPLMTPRLYCLVASRWMKIENILWKLSHLKSWDVGIRTIPTFFEKVFSGFLIISKEIVELTWSYIVSHRH